MDSLKVFKGYDKVEEHKHKHKENHLEDQQQHHRKTSKPFIVTAISIFIILLLTLALTFSLIHHNNANTNTNTESPKPQQQTLKSAESIRVVCNVTRFPDSCIAAISSSAQNPTDPETILKLSLNASIGELEKLASLLGNSKGPALADCKDQIDDSLSRLNDSLSAMAAVPGTMTNEKINDIQTWVSAAMTDQQTCLDGLEEVGSVNEGTKVKNMMKKSSEYVSNSLAIVANMSTLLHQFNIPLH